MVDLKAQYLRFKKEVDTAMMQVAESANYINGPQVHLFTDALKSYLSVESVVPCANGTDALQLALMALDLQPGDEVITTAFSFVASAEVIALMGLKPVFADIDPHTFNIDVSKIEHLISPKTKVLLPVHLFGQPVSMQPLMQLAQRHGLYVIEDVAQSLGASCFYEGKMRMAGSIGHIGCTSFFPTKNLGCFGDGGACFTQDAILGERMKRIASHGADRPYHHLEVGINSRLDTLQAAVLNVKLPMLSRFILERQKVAEVYNSLLKDVECIDVPEVAENVDHTYNLYTIRVKNGRRNELKDGLEDSGFPSRVYYPVPLHWQPAYSRFVPVGLSLPHAEMACNEVLSLPIHTEMSADQAEVIARKVTCLMTKTV